MTQYSNQEPFRGPKAKWDAFSFMVKGASKALDTPLACHTNGREMGVIDIERGASPDVIERKDITYPADLFDAFEDRIQKIGEWPGNDSARNLTRSG